MKLFFLTYDTAFFWVRANTLKSAEARRAGIVAETVFESSAAQTGAFLVFNRFNRSFFYKQLHRLCKSFKVPYLVDIDDLFWELPSFSNDAARTDQAYLKFIDELIESAVGVTVSTAPLLERLRKRYPNQNFHLIENCVPSWNVPEGGTVIANTDAFKMENLDAQWFKNVLFHLHNAGLPIQCLGTNDALVEQFPPFFIAERNQLPYHRYLDHLQLSRFRLGLIPVGPSAYSDCKSDIKLLEFVGAGMTVIASDIEPYRNFVSRYPGSPVTLVENTEAAWTAAVKGFIGTLSNHDREAISRVTEIHIRSRSSQFSQWKEALGDLNRRVTPASNFAYASLRFFTKAYPFLQRLIGAPIKELIGFAKGFLGK